MEMKLKNYRILLHQRPEPDEFHWSEMRAYGFLATRFNSEAVAGAMLKEADAKGKSSDTIVYPLGNTALCEVFPA
jgi:hypothetical protein